jgi:LysR family transcriptional regulator for bpeEF and oprC
MRMSGACAAMDKMRAMSFFCRLVEAKSFTTAARGLDVPQSVLSKAISALEADLQITLIHRSTRRLSLTEAGAGYYDRCRRILLDVDDAEAVARHGAVQPSGTLRIGIHPVFQISLCRRLGEFLKLHPGVDVELAHTNSPATLLEDGLDVMLRVGSMEDSSFVTQRLGWTNLLACASPAYLDIHGRPTHPRHLCQHGAIVPGRRDEASFARWTFSKGKDREVVRVPVSVVLREGVGLAVTALGGVGTVQIYDIAARPFIEEGGLEQILKDWSCGRQPVYAVIPGRQNVPAKVRVFIEFARLLLLP